MADRKTLSLNDPRPVLAAGRLYIGDNGRVFHGAHAGMSAMYTGHDISGQKVTAITADQAAEYDLSCETCGSIELEASNG